MDLVVGIDPSARKLAWVGYAPTLQVFRCEPAILYKATQKQTVAALGLALDRANELVEWASTVCPGGKWYAWVEDPVVGRGGANSTLKQTYVNGIVRGVLHNAGFEVNGVNVSTWKRAVTGNGRAQKPLVQQTVRMQWPKVGAVIGDDVDLADAAAINLFGQRSLRIAAGVGATGSTGRSL